MPLSIMNADRNSKNIVIEMGASKIGDIKYLSSILKPNIGVITNIGNSHLENLKDLDGVLRVKSELIKNIQSLRNPQIEVIEVFKKSDKVLINQKLDRLINKGHFSIIIVKE